MGKKFTEAAKKVENKYYELENAFRVIKEAAFAKFDETVDIAINLGVDPRHSDQLVRGAVVLSNGLGKTVKVLVFAKGEKDREAREAGADFVGAEDMVNEINKGWLGFDRVVATPDMMGVVAKLGKILGPRGLMPNPKTGTVTFSIKETISDIKKGQVEFRVDKGGVVHAPIGKVSFDSRKLTENAVELLAALQKAKPSASKGTYIQKIVVSSTMGPGVKIDLTSAGKMIK